jgi:hypothetical protein
MNKHLLLIGLFFTIAGCVTAQSHTESFTTCGKTFTIKCEAQVDNSIKVSVTDGITDSSKVQYYIWTNDMEVFATIFQQRFSGSAGVADSCKTSEQKNWLAYGRKLLVNYLTSLQNTSPNAGIFKLQDSVILHEYYFDKNNKRQEAGTLKKYKVARLQAEINDGYLENIVAYISKDKKVMRFILPYPVGMSSVNNFKKYDSTELYNFQASPFKMRKADPARSFIKLGELIEYDYFLGVQRRDYSPKDTLLDMQGGTSSTLHKEETKKLFEAHIFSDFQGLNESKPNGLIQAELNKRININTVQHLSPRPLYWLFGSFGYFQYIAPVVTVSKIEQHNKRLSLSDLDSVRLNPGATDTSLFNKNYHRFANALNLYQYQWFSAGTDLNLFYINNHERKYNIYLNVGLRLGFTEVSDSLTSIGSSGITKTGLLNQYTVNTIQAYPEIRINFFPEERFNFSLSHKWVYFKPLGPNVQLVSYDKNNSSKIYPKTSSWLNMSELLMTIQVNPNSKLFGQVRFNWEAGNMKNNFSQIQVGYSTYILGNK